MLELGAGMGILAHAVTQLGVSVTTIELVPELVEYARVHSEDTVLIHCGDFYNIDLPHKYDVVGYFDGFGVGTDKEQLALLKRISKWMEEGGYALIDIYQPSYWHKTSGQEMRIGKAYRKYGYDEENKRMLDSWWKPKAPKHIFTQSLRCYSVEEIHQLCSKANLQIVEIFPGGAMDYQEWIYHEKVPLHQCLSYRIKVKKK